MSVYVVMRGTGSPPADNGLTAHQMQATRLTHTQMNQNFVTVCSAINGILDSLANFRLPSTGGSLVGDEAKLRYDNTLNRVEYNDGTSWNKLGEGATGAGGDRVFYLNDQTVSNSFAIPTGKNAISAGPVTIASGVVVTVPDGSNWVVA